MNAASPASPLRFCIALLLFSLLLAACSPSNPRVNMAGDASTPSQVQLNNWVRRQPPQIFVRPTIAPTSPPTALMVPLRVTQNIRDPVSLSRNLSRTFWQAWLSRQPFSVLEYAYDAQPYDPKRALALGKQKGADLVVGGYITYYLDGGHTGSSSVSISIEIWETATGNLLWSLAQGGFLEYQQAHDFYLFQVRTRQPVDPPSAILRLLAEEMGTTIHDWAHNMPPERGLLDGVFTPKAF
ncbi:MAG: hypothetical protein LBI88_05990 [Deltaproteobacteria bacterium]|jgi:hypothetical protein|nr:hypothetical protein [Deltaproteobacteria bacterium]